MKLSPTLFVSIIASFAVACAPQKPADSAHVSDSASNGSGAAAPAANVAASPELLAAVAKAKTCELGDDGFDSSCEGYSAWNEDAPFFEEGAANPYLVSMLSGDDKSRLLAAEKFHGTATEDETAATVNKVLDAAEHEKKEVIAVALAELVAGLPLAKTGTLDRAIKISKAHSVAAYSEHFISNAPGEAALLPYAIEVAKSPTEDLRNADISLFAALASVTPAEACAGLDGLRSDESNFVKNRATSKLAGVHKCSALYDKLLSGFATLDTGAKGKDMGQDIGYALDSICSDKSASPAQREKAAAVSRKISSSETVSANVRYYTLSAVMGCDPKGGSGFVAKFKSNKSDTLAKRAQSLTAPAKK